ncbi:MAG: hypothetical protein LBP95_04050, partial [Deltaproteobacteria bacterium]|nr:hypothetical protein [Deltaproteobacteria bacterium]
MTTTVDMMVDIPDEKGVHVKSAGLKGEKYVYIYTSYFRNKDGDPRNRAKSIGKYDPASGKMYPNKYYYDYYGVNTPTGDVFIWDYGYSYLILKVCRDTGILDCLTDVFGDLAMDIV